MRAELVIKHDPGDFIASLTTMFGPHDPKVLASSAFAQKSPAAGDAIAYAAQGAAYSVLAWEVPGHTYIFLEATSGQLRDSANHAWSAIQRGAKQLKPKVELAKLFDEDANDVVAVASAGVTAQTGRSELRFSWAVAITTIIWLVVAVSVFKSDADIILGAIPAVLGGLWAVGTLIAGTISQKLVWT